MVYVPTVGKRGGAYVIREPVAIAAVADAEALQRAFVEAIARGNVALPLLKGKRPPPVMLKYTRLKSWPAFVRGTLTWNIQEIEGIYQIVGHRLRTDGSWMEDHDHKIVFPPGTAIGAVIDRMIAILQAAAQ